MLSERLSVCSELVRGKNACDIGTDHGYLAAELLLSGKCERVIASDINENPLKSARETLEKHGLSDKSALFISDGVKDIDLEEVTDIIIAGMGGELIAEIISQKDLSGINLVLQPMTKIPFLRRFLAENGFETLIEKTAREKDRIYVIINAKYSGVKREISELDSLVGKLSPKDEKSAKLLVRTADKLKREADALFSSGNTGEAQKRSELSSKINAILKKEYDV